MPRRFWTREQMIDAGRAWAAEHGHAPFARDWRCASDGHPVSDTASRCFGSWVNFIAACGLEPRERATVWTRAAIIDALQRWAAEHGRTPAKTRDWKCGTADHPASLTVDRAFGSWNAAIVAAGLAPNLPFRASRYVPDQIAGMMLDWLLREGEWPTKSKWDNVLRNDADIPSSQTVEKVCGSWNEARRLAGWSGACRECEASLSGLQRLWCSNRCRQRFRKRGGPRPIVGRCCAGCGGDLGTYTIGCITCTNRRLKRAKRNASGECIVEMASLAGSDADVAASARGVDSTERKEA